MATKRKVAAVGRALDILKRLMMGDTLTARAVADAHEIKEPAARTLLSQLEECVQGINHDGNRPRGYSFAWPAHARSKEAHLLAIAAARSLLPSLQESAIGDALDDMFLDLANRSGSPSTAQADLCRRFHSGSRRTDLKCLDEIVAGLLRCHEIRADYHHFNGQMDSVVVRPLTLTRFVDRVYVYAECVSCGVDDHVQSRRLYNVERMSNVRCTTTRFAYPTTGYEPDQLFGASFAGFIPMGENEDVTAEEVVLDLAPSWEHYLTRNRVHASQSSPERQADGWWQIRLRVYVLLDLVRWVRGLGNECRVVKPASLEEKVSAGCRDKPLTSQV